MPVIAIGLTAAVFMMSRNDLQERGLRLYQGAALEAGMELVNPRYSGVTADDEPFTIIAASARPDGPDPSEIALDAVESEVALTGGRMATLTAQAGVWRRDDNHLTLTGDVALATDDGYTMRSDIVNADIARRVVVTDGPVFGDGPLGAIEAGRGRFTDEGGGVAHFEDGVRVRIIRVVESRANGE